jgi:hypothetical protein
MKHLVITAAILAATASPAFADVKAASETGFNVIHIASVQATPDEIWKRLLAPKDYWNKSHSWSGSTAGFYIDAQANGCFCELFQETDANGKVKTVGSVEHMRVIFAQPGKVLRMQGALGPLQSEAVIGTLTVAMEPAKQDGSTRISFSYVVGGYMRYKVAEIAPAVDKVLGEQFKNMLLPFAPTADEPSKVDGFNLDVETLDIAPAAEAADTNEAPADPAIQDDSRADPPAPEPN